MLRLNHRAPLVAASIAIAVGAATAAGVALAGGGTAGQTSTTGHAVSADLNTAAHNALERLVGAGTISQAQADAVQAQVEAGRVEPKTLVDGGTVSDAQMHAIANVLDDVKRSFG